MKLCDKNKAIFQILSLDILFMGKSSTNLHAIYLDLCTFFWLVKWDRNLNLDIFTNNGLHTVCVLSKCSYKVENQAGCSTKSMAMTDTSNTQLSLCSSCSSSPQAWNSYSDLSNPQPQQCTHLHTNTKDACLFSYASYWQKHILYIHRLSAFSSSFSFLCTHTHTQSHAHCKDCQRENWQNSIFQQLIVNCR